MHTCIHFFGGRTLTFNKNDVACVSFKSKVKPAIHLRLRNTLVPISNNGSSLVDGYIPKFNSLFVITGTIEDLVVKVTILVVIL